MHYNQLTWNTLIKLRRTLFEPNVEILINITDIVISNFTDIRTHKENILIFRFFQPFI